MRRLEPDVRLLCYASVIVLSLTACSHSGGKLKSGTNITENAQAASTSGDKKSRSSQGAKNGGRWLKKKENSLASGSSQYDNLWDRLFDLYDLPPIEHEEIDRELNWFISHPAYIERVQERAEPFLYSIVKQVEKHDIPGEIALLPVIESAFQPHAVSPANAAGIWQFIPSTGRLYGLKRSHTYDGRRDIYASTKAAIKYLKKLHREFNGDWLLAIAAYNCGEGAVERAISRNMARGLPTDFWSLDLPQETRSYVPRLLAVSKLFVGAEQYGVDLHEIPNTARFKPVKVSTQLDLALAADAADMPLEKLYALNPGFKGKFADVEGSYHLFIPAEKKAAEFRQELERLALEGRSIPPSSSAFAEAKLDEKDSAELTSGSGEAASGPVREVRFEPAYSSRPPRETYYEPLPVKDEKVERTASTFRTTESVMRKTPTGERIPQGKERAEARNKTQSHVTEQGKDRRVPEPVAMIDKMANKPEDRSTKKGNYTVLPGETLWAVARKYSVDVGQLAKWNNFSDKTKVEAGQRLVVWNKDAAKKLPPMATGIRPSQSINYTVREGDTLFSISRRFKVSVADLRRSNGSNVDKQIQPGKNITVPKDKD